MTPTAEALGVSRETFERLTIYADLLTRWNPRINLVSKSTLDDLWNRHIRDSLQLLHLPGRKIHQWADLGSGGGFPGLVIALATEPGRPETVTLVESDQRKATFLRTVLRETGTTAQVIAKRIEDTPPLGADILSARALADLTRLLAFAERHLSQGGTCLFPKGRTWKSELQSAQQAWHFSCEAIASQTESQAVVLKIEGLSRV